MSEEEIVISFLDHSFLSHILDIHIAALREDLLPAMGQSTLKAYYNFVLQDKSQVLMGLFVGSNIVGFCQISLQPIRVGTIILSNPLLLFRIAKFMICHPALFFTACLETISRSFNKLGYMCPEISFIALLPTHQKRGYGVALVNAANGLLREKGYMRVYTKTGNIYAKKMYEKYFSARIEREYRVLARFYWHLSWVSRSPH